MFGRKIWIKVFGAVLLAVALCSASIEESPRTPKLAARVYRAWLAAKGLKPADLQVYSIGHSHIDAAWRWRVAETHQKVERTFAQAVENMETRPDFTFSQSQPALYEWMLTERPELFARIVEMVKAGRWEPVGGMWVEPDGNVPEGESFVRQRLVGQRFYLEHFGQIAEIGWMPDSFGYNLNFPQLFAKSGSRFLWAKKINTNFETVFPFHNFVWRAPDGSELVTTLNEAAVGLEFFTYPEIGKFRDTRFLAPEGAPLVADYSWTPAAIKAALSRDWFNVVGDFYGEGDGHAGPMDFEIDIQEELQRRGYVRIAPARDFFAELEAVRGRLPVWTDELYLERHQGTLTTQAWIKRANRKAEQDLRAAETLSAILDRLGRAYPFGQLLRLWKTLLFNQFHDILPGSSIPEVYEDARPEYERLDAETDAIIGSGLAALGRMVGVRPPRSGLAPVLVFNALGWERSDLVSLPLENSEELAAFDPDGTELPAQIIEEDGARRIVFRAPAVPAVGYKVFYLGPSAGSQSAVPAVSVREDGDRIALENEAVTVAVSRKSGHIVSLAAKDDGTELIAAESNRVKSYHDRHRRHRAWNIQKDYLRHPIGWPDAATLEVTAAGPLFVEVTATRTLKRGGRDTTLVQKVRLFAGDPMVRLELFSDYHLENSLTKLEFNTTLDADAIAADGPYLVVERPTHPQTPAEKARWEMPCQKWIDLSDGGRGLALFNNGKHGFSLTENGQGFRLSIVKGAEYPAAYDDAEDVAHYQAGALPYTDQGEHRMSFGLLPHSGGWREAGLVRAGSEFNQPLRAAPIKGAEGGLPSEYSFLAVESDSVYLGAVKRAEDGAGLVLRLIEAHGQTATATVRLCPQLAIARALETDLLELNPRPLPSSPSSISLTLGPYEIKTVKLELR